MKKKAEQSGSGETLNDAIVPYAAAPAAMVRTQVYLTRAEHRFLQIEANRRDTPMASLIREFIDEKMKVADDAWSENPMLRPAPQDPQWDGREDGALNHDHYIHGAPKRWIKKQGRWVEAPPLPQDYFENRASAAAYDRMVSELDEAR